MDTGSRWHPHEGEEEALEEAWPQTHGCHGSHPLALTDADTLTQVLRVEARPGPAFVTGALPWGSPLLRGGPSPPCHVLLSPKSPFSCRLLPRSRLGRAGVLLLAVLERLMVALMERTQASSFFLFFLDFSC